MSPEIKCLLFIVCANIINGLWNKEWLSVYQIIIIYLLYMILNSIVSLGNMGIEIINQLYGV